MTSDEALMLEFQRGSREAFEELFARYRDPLYGFFHRRLPSRARAEDLTQDVFLAVMRAASRYEPRALVRTYPSAAGIVMWMPMRNHPSSRGPTKHCGSARPWTGLTPTTARS